MILSACSLSSTKSYTRKSIFSRKCAISFSWVRVCECWDLWVAVWVFVLLRFKLFEWYYIHIYLRSPYTLYIIVCWSVRSQYTIRMHHCEEKGGSEASCAVQTDINSCIAHTHIWIGMIMRCSRGSSASSSEVQEVHSLTHSPLLAMSIGKCLGVWVGCWMLEVIARQFLCTHVHLWSRTMCSWAECVWRLDTDGDISKSNEPNGGTLCCCCSHTYSSYFIIFSAYCAALQIRCRVLFHSYAFVAASIMYASVLWWSILRSAGMRKFRNCRTTLKRRRRRPRMTMTSGTAQSKRQAVLVPLPIYNRVVCLRAGAFLFAPPKQLLRWPMDDTMV